MCLGLEPCVCSTTWSDPESGGTCSKEQVGCPETSCDGEPRWCIIANDVKCATDLGGWTLCDDSTPVYGSKITYCGGGGRGVEIQKKFQLVHV